MPTNALSSVNPDTGLLYKKQKVLMFAQGYCGPNNVGLNLIQMATKYTLDTTAVQ